MTTNVLHVLSKEVRAQIHQVMNNHAGHVTRIADRTEQLLHFRPGRLLGVAKTAHGEPDLFVANIEKILRAESR